jgi:hypothetical protein
LAALIELEELAALSQAAIARFSRSLNPRLIRRCIRDKRADEPRP